jgi:hypothetical protein
VIRADLSLVADPPTALEPPGSAPLRRSAQSRQAAPKTLAPPGVSPLTLPAWARANGRGEGDPRFAAGAALALLDAHLRSDPPAAGALRARLALASAATSAKLLRLNADAAALRDLRFAVAAESLPATKLLQLWRELASRPPSLDAGRLAVAMGLLDLPGINADALAQSLSETSRAGDPLTAATKSAAALFVALPDAPTAPAEILSHWAFDLTLATRLRWPRPVPLLSTAILEPTLRASGGGRPKPDDPAWPNIAAGALALAAGSALDRAADLARRADILLAVAPRLRAKPAAKVVNLLLAEDGVAPAEAARHAPMTDRAARRLFDRLVALGAARELSGRPAFRVYGL